MRSAVTVDHLVKRFGSHPAVDDVSFWVESGEVFGLLGPNGAGKTTTIRVLTTLTPPTAGHVTVGGLLIGRQDAAIRSIVGYVPQALSADGALTGYENLLVFAKLLGIGVGEREQRIARTLGILQLEEAAHRPVSTYSGGMVRRLEIGQALLQTPKLLIMDEPTVGLDPTARRAIWNIIEEERRSSDLTVLITTHYMEEADAHCDRVAVMARGKIVAIGPPEALKAHVGQPQATLEDVFTALTGEALDIGGGLREQRQVRRRHRLG